MKRILLLLTLAGCSGQDEYARTVCMDDYNKLYVGMKTSDMELCYLHRPPGQSLVRSTVLGSTKQEIYQDVTRPGHAYVFVEDGQVVGWTGRGP